MFGEIIMQRLTWPSRISYGVGAFGKDLVYAIVATFYMFYLTDICKISPISSAISSLWRASSTPSTIRSWG